MKTQSPFIEEILAEHRTIITQTNIIEILMVRFGPLPDDLVARIQTTNDLTVLQRLIRPSASCDNLEMFRRQWSF